MPHLAVVSSNLPLLSAEKNLKALKTIMASLPGNTRLAFVGDGPERAALQQHYADMPNVKFMVSVDSNSSLTSALDISVSSGQLLQRSVIQWFWKAAFLSAYTIAALL